MNTMWENPAALSPASSRCGLGSLAERGRGQPWGSFPEASAGRTEHMASPLLDCSMPLAATISECSGGRSFRQALSTKEGHIPSRDSSLSAPLPGSPCRPEKLAGCGDQGKGTTFLSTQRLAGQAPSCLCWSVAEVQVQAWRDPLCMWL